MSKEGRKGCKQTGIADEPGMWDNCGMRGLLPTNNGYTLEG